MVGGDGPALWGPCGGGGCAYGKHFVVSAAFGREFRRSSSAVAHGSRKQTLASDCFVRDQSARSASKIEMGGPLRVAVYCFPEFHFGQLCKFPRHCADSMGQRRTLYWFVSRPLIEARTTTCCRLTQSPSLLFRRLPGRWFQRFDGVPGVARRNDDPGGR
jgi:hypothetical protein